MLKSSKLVLTFALVAGMAMTAWAAVPAPPVNQHLGLGDTTFNNMVESDCRTCHNQTPPAPYPVDPTYLPDRHHLLVDTAIPTPTDVPNPDADGDGVADVNYDCLNCHSMTFNDTTGTWELDPNFRDCTECHVQTGTSGPTVHHKTTEAQGGDCAYCHGSFVDSGLLDDDGDGIQNAIDPDGGWIPTYQVSLVTPFPGGLTPGSGLRKPNGDPLTVNSWGQEAGNCSFCHSELTGIEGNSVIEDTGPFAPVEVFVNSTTHHTTGLQTADKCIWCHQFDVLDPDDPRALTPIRTCENCHGIPSLHNIQFAGQDFGFPNNDGTVTPGAEPAGFGHIGSQDDCWGCHGYENPGALSAPSSGPVVPGLYSLSASSVQAGNSVLLSGTAFVNEVQNPMTGEYDNTLTSDVVLIDASGAETVLAPTSVVGDTIGVEIPAAIPAGNYQIAAKKALKLSNPLNLAITPDMTVASATCAGPVTVTGNGFGGYLATTDSGTSVSGTVDGSAMTGAVISWSGTEIVADFVVETVDKKGRVRTESVCPSDVTVATVFGATATAELGGGDPPTGSCADYGNEAECNGDSACAWSDKKGGSCKDAGSGGGGGGKPPKDK